MPKYISKKSDKNIIVSQRNNSKHKNNEKTTSQKVAEDLTFYVELSPDHSDYKSSPTISDNCKSKENCGKILSSDLWTKRFIKIAILCSVNEIGISSDFEKLCGPCRNNVFQWYKKEINETSENLEIFSARIAEANSAQNYRESYEFVSRLVDSISTPQERIDSALNFYQSVKQRYYAAKSNLAHEIDRNNAIKRGYEV